MRAAKRVRHFQAEYERKLRHIERHNAASWVVLGQFYAAHARWGRAKVGTPRAGRLG
jgi:cytochrome c-type biogenesis protein CcmH/NrfG